MMARRAERLFRRNGISASGELASTFPLVGRVGARRQACAACASLAALRRGGGGAVMLESVSKMDPHPQPLPSRLRACPFPVNLKVTKPRQAGVWLGRGADRVRRSVVRQIKRNTR